MIHTLHPDTHEFGLADDCERCAQHAEHPFDSLDNDNLRRLYYRVVEEQEPRSETEATAMTAVQTFRRQLRRLEAAMEVTVTADLVAVIPCTCPAAPVPHEHKGTVVTRMQWPPRVTDQQYDDVR